MCYKKLVMWFGLIFFIFAGISFPQDDSNSNNDLQKTYLEYQLIKQKLQILQQQALLDSGIAQQGARFSNKLDSAMVKQNPSIKEKLKKRDKIIDSFTEAQKNGNEEKMLELQKQLQSVTDELQTHQQVALKDKKLQDEGEKLGEAVVKKMTEIDPQVPDMLARLEILGQKLQQGTETHTHID
jgi:hypothetical protein